MKPQQIDIEHVAHLARMQLTPTEVERFGQQLASVLVHMEQLQKLDVASIEPTAHTIPVTNVWREDVERPGLSAEEALANAPQKANHLIIMPRIVE